MCGRNLAGFMRKIWMTPYYNSKRTAVSNWDTRTFFVCLRILSRSSQLTSYCPIQRAILDVPTEISISCIFSGKPAYLSWWPNLIFKRFLSVISNTVSNARWIWIRFSFYKHVPLCFYHVWYAPNHVFLKFVKQIFSKLKHLQRLPVVLAKNACRQWTELKIDCFVA